ncbi:HAMP domain-containing histidine kinase [Sutcliffiella horikoshii]|uniref:histidine kinase n=1 Tax=Sutcliffiella horikoshii TaxID=79883 RepID=A0A5D4SQ88_9BACI|nr:histidine kinase dimerization/phospho-acceptor domain-containing protein [Sutcliffiella horikoshii]TYS64514.1 HAMP domain-containing histidine kinase [Sutcliffiella horikoshii]
MNFLKDILLQLFFLFVPLLLYYSLVHKRYRKPSEFRRQLAAFFYCTISALLCSTFPILVASDTTFYLSGIPVIMSILYGGYLAGILTVIALFIYPLFFPSPINYLHAYFLIPFLSVLPLLIQAKWGEYSNSLKYLLISTIAGIGAILHGITFVILDKEWMSIVSTDIVFIGSTLLLFYVVEYFCGLDQLQNQYKKLKKLYHINTIADEVSKEFQQPLTMVKGFIQLLGAEHNRANKEYVPIILTELNRAEKIIDSYIKLAKTETFSSRPLSSKELLDLVASDIQIYANSHNIHFQINSERNLRLNGNLNLLAESISTIIKFCIPTNDEANKRLLLNHYLQYPEVIFELVIKDGNAEKDPIKTLLQLQDLRPNEEDTALYSAYTILLAHGGDLQYRNQWFRKSIILTLPAQVKKSDLVTSNVIRTN